MKIKIKRLISSVCFVLIFLVIFQTVNSVFRDKAFIFSLAPVYDLPEDSLDVLFFGSSHMNCSVSPMQLYNEHGIASFNCAIGDQAIPSSYYTMKEMLRIQKPKVIVLETFYMGVDEKVGKGGDARLHWLTDNIPQSSNRREMIENLPGEDVDASEYHIPFLRFHSRWKSLSAYDLNPDYQPYLRGANLVTGYKRFNSDVFASVPREDYLEPSELVLEYLDKIIALCEENDVQLVFMAAPFKADYDSGEKEKAQYMNYTYKISEETGIPYVDFFALQEEIGFDPRRDMREYSHLNIRGVEKITSYMGSWLKENYDLPDHRGDSNYSFWDEDYEEYEAYIRDLKLKCTYDNDEYFEQLEYYRQSEDYLFCLTMNNPEIENNNLYCWTVMNNFFDEMPSDMRYAAKISRGGEILHEEFSDEVIYFNQMFGDLKLQVGSSTNHAGVYIGGTGHARRGTGVNIVVYDLKRGRLCDSVNFVINDFYISRAAK